MTRADPTRQVRGERRRQAILEAALRLISKHGVGALTHRAVAEEADVPLASTTYYFDSLDELLEGALHLFVEEEATRLTALAERLEGQDLPPVEIARLFQAELEPDAAQFELYVEAARRPSLRKVARQSIEMYATGGRGRAARGRPRRARDQPAGLRRSIRRLRAPPDRRL